MGMGESAIVSALSLFPSILGLDVKSMQRRVAFLKEIGMDKDDIAATLSRQPTILAYHVANNLRPTWEYLTRHFGLTLDAVVATPSYFGLSLPGRIVPRHRFLLERGLMPKTTPWRALKVTDAAFVRDYCAGATLEDYYAFRKSLQARLAAEAKAAGGSGAPPGGPPDASDPQ